MKQQYLEKLSFWAHLNPQEQKLVLKNSYEKEYDAGTLIFSSNEKCIGIMVVTSGILRSFLASEDGRRTTILRMRQNSVCVSAMTCLFPEIDYEMNLEAESKSSVVVVPASTFKQLVDKNIFIENFAYKIVTQQFSYLVNAIEQLIMKTLEQRIVTFLLDESSAVKSNEIHITKEQLAENIGSARESVSRILTKLSKENFVNVQRGMITLIDKPTLYKMT